MAKRVEVPDWETLLAHAAVLQARIPSAILVGGTAAAIHSGHRFSTDHDRVVANLAKNYDTAIRALETISGWRTVPLETTEVSVRGRSNSLAYDR